MRSRKSALATGLSTGVSGNLEQQLALSTHDQKATVDIARLTLRLPVATRRELRDLADSRNISINELIAVFIDRGLVEEGRPSIAESAPWFAGHLRRSKAEIVEENRADDFG
jgi:hypothetical protein